MRSKNTDIKNCEKKLKATIQQEGSDDMEDIEKVIQGLESCWVKEPGILNCKECPYKEHIGKGRLQSCTDRLHIDALKILTNIVYKSTIPIIHEYRDTDLTVKQCGNCLAQLFLENQKYCAECGSRIRWDDVT